ncbi:MAG: aminoacyl-tRNA hydrolase [Clostridiales bacterium]|nr:aminoacyl-tRNA hydrolase [Clostridiales bacterium]
MYVIAGLGNPGARYETTRHNAGYLAVEWLRELLGAPEWKSRFQGQVSQCRVGAEQVLLVRPETFMNASGKCLAELAHFYKLPPEAFIVIYDDIDLSVGSLRVRANGSAGTHNGMRSIVEELGTQSFARKERRQFFIWLICLLRRFGRMLNLNGWQTRSGRG